MHLTVTPWGASALSANWIIFWGCWGILGGMGSISCCRALLFADRPSDCPPMLPSTPLRHRHLDPSSRGRLPRAMCPPHWPHAGVFVLSSEPQWVLEHLDDWLTEGPVFSPPALSLLHLSWMEGTWVENRNAFGVEDAIFKRGVVSDNRWRWWLRADSSLSAEPACAGDVLSLGYLTLNWPELLSNPVLGT